MTMYRCTNTRAAELGRKASLCVVKPCSLSGSFHTHTYSQRMQPRIANIHIHYLHYNFKPLFQLTEKTMQSSCYFTSSFLLFSCSAHERSTLQTTSLVTRVNFCATPVVRLLRPHFYILMKLQESQDLRLKEAQKKFHIGNKLTEHYCFERQNFTFSFTKTR